MDEYDPIADIEKGNNQKCSQPTWMSPQITKYLGGFIEDARDSIKRRHRRRRIRAGRQRHETQPKQAQSPNSQGYSGNDTSRQQLRDAADEHQYTKHKQHDCRYPDMCGPGRRRSWRRRRWWCVKFLLVRITHCLFLLRRGRGESISVRLEITRL